MLEDRLQEWLRAAELHRPQSRKLFGTPVEFNQSPYGYNLKDLNDVTAKLEQFLKSKPGRAAIDLLSACGKEIIFGKENGEGSLIIYSLSGSGLRSLSRPTGFWKNIRDLFNNAFPRKEIASIDELKAVKMACILGNKKTSEFMPWLFKEIDAVAKEALASGAANNTTIITLVTQLSPIHAETKIQQAA